MATSASIGFLGATLEPHVRQFDLTPVLLGKNTENFLIESYWETDILNFCFDSNRNCFYNKWWILCSHGTGMGMDG